MMIGQGLQAYSVREIICNANHFIDQQMNMMTTKIICHPTKAMWIPSNIQCKSEMTFYFLTFHSECESTI